ncbi:1-phosphofructokinase [Paenibacillus aestuarii]|uniref:Tagatose-6-phosphate kinase n=1 Tax=Paenibacillus aestuarii TaxID=516965 RepID=A0ABW0KDR0_9BACL|nr:1-phosphofructokinase [Paenibacillus aestuarii]
MITTVTLNAAIDKTYYVQQFASGGVHRVVRQIAEPGGKGNNVAKVAKLLGADVTATGLIGGSSGSFIETQLAARGIRTSFIRVPGESRVCLNIIDEHTGVSTELLEQGPDIAADHVLALKNTLRSLAAESSVVVLSGSLPPGAPAALYADLIGVIQAAGAHAFLDTSGAALSSGLEAQPYFVKPNEQELAAWMGRELASEAAWTEAAAKLAGAGIAQVCVTLGSRGTIAIIDGAAYRVHPPLIQAVNTVGCGDAFVAGMAYAEERGESPLEKLRIATAAAAANAMSDKAGHLDEAVFAAYLPQVQVTAL